MAITMQGSWIIRVKSKNAAFAQRFIISGADSGNGTYIGTVSSPDVSVTGDNWVIDIQNNPGSGFIPSEMQITSPKAISGMYQFDIQSNDAGPDNDFNDLILTCLTPVTEQDFILYGNVSYYDGPCLFNPCFFRLIVIDDYEQLLQAVKIPILRSTLEALYPNKLKQLLREQNGEASTIEFKPLVLPLQSETAIPANEQMLLRLRPEEFKIKTGAKKSEKLAFNTVSSLQTLATPISIAERIKDIDRVSLGKIVDRVKRFCTTGPISHSLIGFQEYDRTSAELAGDVYSGFGIRENLGKCYTDRNGNYIFRFKKSVSEFVAEATTDTAIGEDVLIQQMPDIIAQLLDEDDINTAICETAPYWNVPLLRRINICISKSKLKTVPRACGKHDNIIQGIGNIDLGPLNTSTNVRIGFGNTLAADGKITTTAAAPTPRINCAAWRGLLEVIGCMTNKDIYYYTIRYKKASEAASKYKFVDDSLVQKRYKTSNPLLTETKDVSVSVPLRINGNSSAAQTVKAFINVENDTLSLWTEKSKILKARLNSNRYPNGPVNFLIETYKQDGKKLSFQETLTLHIDNAGVDRDIKDEVALGGVEIGNCALFTLPNGNPAAPLTVKFKADHPNGFMNNYQITMEKGATGGFAILPSAQPAVLSLAGKLSNVPNTGRTFENTPINCALGWVGTANEPDASLEDGYYVVNISPQSGAWLATDEQFCAFSIRLGGHTRHTNGVVGPIKFPQATPVLIGIQKEVVAP